MQPEYLTEEKLGLILDKLYPGKVERQHRMPNKTKVDFLLDDVSFKRDYLDRASIYVEFNGNLHYQKKSTINRDLINAELIGSVNHLSKIVFQ